MEPSLRLNYADGVKILNEAGVEMNDDEDLTCVLIVGDGSEGGGAFARRKMSC
jgi:hypothetical protein